MPRASFGPLQFVTMALLALAVAYLGWLGYGALPRAAAEPTPAPVFSGAAALQLAQAQCDLGPRPSGSPAGWRTGNWIIENLRAQGWSVETQEFAWNSIPVRNIIAKAGQGPAILLGAHYDTRLVSDRDTDLARLETPGLGANDAAAGVAVLLELARVLDTSQLQNEVWLAFFDAEANDGLPDWQAAIGSARFGVDLERLPRAEVKLDRVGGAQPVFSPVANAGSALQQTLWGLAGREGAGGIFANEPGSGAVAFALAERGVPTAAIIDANYPYWHTTNDTCDKLSAVSLGQVGRVLQAFLEQGLAPPS